MAELPVITELQVLVEIIRKGEHYYQIRQRYSQGAPANAKERDLMPKAEALSLYAQHLRKRAPRTLVQSNVYGIRAEAGLYADALEQVAKEFLAL